ncbi:MAG: FHA domain-containing protein, partial [Planctomycetota bacterium]
MIDLKIMDEGRDWVFRLGEQKKVLIGRAPTNDIQIRANRSSRVHCQIEKVPNGYKLVDLESRNGTRVNDETVNSRNLTPGDRIQIGGTVIQFGEPVELEPIPAAPTPPPAEAKEPKAPEHTVRIEKRPSHSHHRVMVPPRRPRVPWELMVIGGGLMFTLIVGSVIYNMVQASGERAKLLKVADKAWVEVEREFDLDLKLNKMEEAIEKFHKVERMYPDSSEGSKARSKLKTIEPEYKRLSYWVKYYKAISQSRKMAGDSHDLDQLLNWVTRLKKMEADCPFGGMAAQAGSEVEALLKGVDEAANRLIESQRKDLEVSLAGEDYAGVLMKWELFREKYSRFPAVTRAVEKEVEAVREKVKGSFEGLTEKVDNLIAEKRYQEAKALLDRARERYLGTETAAQVAMKAQVVSLVQRGTTENRAQAEEIVEAKKEIYLSAAQAETHARRREFSEAISIYQDILSHTSDPDVTKEFGARVSELKAIQGLFTLFIRGASTGALEGENWDIGNGTIVKIRGADQEWVYFSLPQQAGSTQKRWKAFSARELISLLDLVVSSGEGNVILALFAYRNNLEKEGEELLIRAYKKSPDLGDRISEILARVRGEAVPPGGYVVYNDRWYTRKERDRAVAE